MTVVLLHVAPAEEEVSRQDVVEKVLVVSGRVVTLVDVDVETELDVTVSN